MQKTVRRSRRCGRCLAPPSCRRNDGGEKRLYHIMIALYVAHSDILSVGSTYGAWAHSLTPSSWLSRCAVKNFARLLYFHFAHIIYFWHSSADRLFRNNVIPTRLHFPAVARPPVFTPSVFARTQNTEREAEERKMEPPQNDETSEPEVGTYQ